MCLVGTVGQSNFKVMQWLLGFALKLLKEMGLTHEKVSNLPNPFPIDSFDNKAFATMFL